LVGAGAACSVKSSGALITMVSMILLNKLFIDHAVITSRKYVANNKGATERIIVKIKELNPSK
jgi:hypothetical protein